MSSRRAKEHIQLFLSSRKAKDHIQRIITKGQGLPDSGGGHEGVSMEEVMIPGNKVGLVIGKGGENIKLLQVRYDADNCIPRLCRFFIRTLPH